MLSASNKLLLELRAALQEVSKVIGGDEKVEVEDCAGKQCKGHKLLPGECNVGKDAVLNARKTTEKSDRARTSILHFNNTRHGLCARHHHACRESRVWSSTNSLRNSLQPRNRREIGRPCQKTNA